MTVKFPLVFFDVDSTLVTIEGINILGEGNPEVTALTEAVMNGVIPIDQVYAKRLKTIRPTLAAVEALGQRYCQSLVEGARETIGTLRSAGAAVHLVSAAIEQALIPLAAALEIPERSVHAVRVEFSAEGEYRDFDRHTPLTRPGGKETVVRDVRARTHGKAAFVGDGASDLETKSAVDLFIGFGGVHARPLVRENADVFVPGPRLDGVLTYLV